MKFKANQNTGNSIFQKLFNHARNARDVINILPTTNDGLTFDPNSISAAPIREDQIYDGVRVTFTGQLHTARIPVQIDVGFGDETTNER